MQVKDPRAHPATPRSAARAGPRHRLQALQGWRDRFGIRARERVAVQPLWPLQELGHMPRWTGNDMLWVIRAAPRRKKVTIVTGLVTQWPDLTT
jgi:hypothetical protein